MKLSLLPILFLSFFCKAQKSVSCEVLGAMTAFKISNVKGEHNNFHLYSIKTPKLGVLHLERKNDSDEVLSPLCGFKMSTDKSEVVRFHIISFTMFALGMTVNTHDILTNNPEYFFVRFPNASMHFWNLQESCNNKYKNGNPEEGRAFPFSTTALVGLTDGWHLTNTLAHFQIGTVISLSVFSKDYHMIKPLQAVARIAYFSACYYVGYNFMDKIVYKHY